MHACMLSTPTPVTLCSCGRCSVGGNHVWTTGRCRDTFLRRGHVGHGDAAINEDRGSGRCIRPVGRIHTNHVSSINIRNAKVKVIGSPRRMETWKIALGLERWSIVPRFAYTHVNGCIDAVDVQRCNVKKHFDTNKSFRGSITVWSTSAAMRCNHEWMHTTLPN
jgi:hypothetical protein